LVERLRSGAGRRALGLGLTLAIEALVLLLLLGLVSEKRDEIEEVRLTMVSLPAEKAAEEAPEDRAPDSERPARQPEPEEPRPPQPAEPAAAPPPPAILLPTPWQLPPPAAAPRSDRPVPARPVYGPPDTRPAAMRDTERVGTAPNGEPLYAASWYREPDDAMLRAYLSTANGPGWGLIACRTAPGYRVEDCVALEEYPQGSQINRSVLAAAWEFRVRPPRRGGRLMVGSWVRIRISYDIVRH
jgi:protein TonB